MLTGSQMFQDDQIVSFDDLLSFDELNDQKVAAKSFKFVLIYLAIQKC